MYVCLCGQVTDEEIREAARNGACCMEDLNKIGVANNCGQCSPCAQTLLDSAMATPPANLLIANDACCMTAKCE